MAKRGTKEHGRKIAAVAPWHGGNRETAERIGAALGTLVWCGVPFSGGVPELPFIDARTGVANDLHRHVINLCRVIKERPVELAERLRDVVFHPDELSAAQAVCVSRGVAVASLFAGGGPVAISMNGDLDWAAAYFVSAWMTRGGNAGTLREFMGGLAVRFAGGGGGSGVRFRSAIDSLPGWSRVFERWEFTAVDAFDFLDKVSDEAGYGIYADPPWPRLGKNYANPVDMAFHERLAKRLGKFEAARIVVRYGDDEFIRRLYPARQWDWDVTETRNAANNVVRDAVIVRRGR